MYWMRRGRHNRSAAPNATAAARPTAGARPRRWVLLRAMLTQYLGQRAQATLLMRDVANRPRQRVADLSAPAPAHG